MIYGSRNIALLASVVLSAGCGQPRPHVDQAIAAPPVQDDASSSDPSPSTRVEADVADVVEAAIESPPTTCHDIECPAWHYCEPAGDPPACHAYKAAGTPCESHYQCADYLFCETWAEVPKCRKAPGKGGDCEMTSGICAEGFYCDLLEYPALCKYPGKAGKPCCGDQACEDGLYCDTQDPDQSRCKPLTTQECNIEAQPPCPEGQFCDEERLTPLCLPLGIVGQYCADDSQCTKGLTCSRDPDNYRDLCTAPK